MNLKDSHERRISRIKLVRFITEGKEKKYLINGWYPSNSQFGYCPQNLSRIAKLAG
jgi:hypothetical protein